MKKISSDAGMHFVNDPLFIQRATTLDQVEPIFVQMTRTHRQLQLIIVILPGKTPIYGNVHPYIHMY